MVLQTFMTTFHLCLRHRWPLKIHLWLKFGMITEKLWPQQWSAKGYVCVKSSFVPKNIRSSFRSRTIQLEAFCPPLHGDVRDAKLHLLCPVHVCPFSAQNSCSCLWNALTVVWAHTTCGVAALTDLFCGVNGEEICMSCLGLCLVHS